MNTTYIPKKDYKMIKKQQNDTQVISLRKKKDYYTIKDVVESVPFSYPTVRKDCENGTLKTIMRGASKYVTHSEFMKYLKGD